MVNLTQDQSEAIMDAVMRDVTDSRTPWDEIKDMTLADFCAQNQDALIDDIFEQHPDDTQDVMAGKRRWIRVYDELLGTDRSSELPGSRDLTKS